MRFKIEKSYAFGCSDITTKEIKSDLDSKISGTLTDSLDKNVETIENILCIKDSFDLVKRIIHTKSGQRCAFFYVAGFADGQTVQDFIRHCITLQDMELTEQTVPFVEASMSADTDKVIQKILTGMTCMLIEGQKAAFLMDMRKMPTRGVEEPENDKVLRGARDGFGESLQPNATLIRRRIRSPLLTFSVITVGTLTRTDVCLCYMKGKADETFVRNLKEQISNLKLESVNFQVQTLCESLIRKKWYNPFPKVRYTERPDAAAASILEGSVLLMCDNSPSCVILPTSILDFFQETDDFCFPPLTGSYLRIVRFLVYVLSIYLTPVWYILQKTPENLPDFLKFLELSQKSGIPVFWQLLIVELAIDGVRLASLNTPDVLGNSLSIVSGLILGDFAVSSGWFSPDVILYTAFVTIANFTQTSYELGYAIKFMRVIMLVLAYLLGWWGILISTLIMVLLIAANTSIPGSRSYLYPLIPFNGRALLSLIIRLKNPKKASTEKQNM